MSQAKSGSTELELSTGAIFVPETVDWTGAGKMVIRPHQISLERKKTRHEFSGEITYAAYLGNQIQYSVKGDLGNLFVVSDPKMAPLTVGDAVSIEFNNEDVRLVQS